MTNAETDVNPATDNVPIRNGDMKFEAVVIPVPDLWSRAALGGERGCPTARRPNMDPLYRPIEAG